MRDAFHCRDNRTRCPDDADQLEQFISDKRFKRLVTDFLDHRGCRAHAPTLGTGNDTRLVHQGFAKGAL